jgi:hypothetical protein
VSNPSRLLAKDSESFVVSEALVKDGGRGDLYELHTARRIRFTTYQGAIEKGRNLVYQLIRLRAYRYFIEEGK